MRSTKLTLIAVSGLLLASAQSFAQTGFDFSLKGNIQTSSLLNTTDQAAGPELNFKNKVTMAIGVAGGYSFNKHMGVELDILSSKQGQGYTGDASQLTNSTGGVKILSQEFQYLASANHIAFSGNYTADIALSCLKIPILFRYTGENTKKVYFSSFIGPQINMLSSATVQVNGKTASFSSLNISATDLYKKTTVDAVLGVGVGINLSKNFALSVHLRLDYGLGDVENKSETLSAQNGGGKIYDASRAATQNATGGGLITLTYKLTKKAKETGKGNTAPKKKP